MQRAVHFFQQTKHPLAPIFAQHIAQARPSGQQLLAHRIYVSRFPIAMANHLIRLRGLWVMSRCSLFFSGSSPLPLIFSPRETTLRPFPRDNHPACCGQTDSRGRQFFSPVRTRRARRFISLSSRAQPRDLRFAGVGKNIPNRKTLTWKAKVESIAPKAFCRRKRTADPSASLGMTN